MNGTSARRTGLLTLCCLALAGCTARAEPAPAPAGVVPFAPETDTAMVAAVIRHLRERRPHDRLRIDPRPLRTMPDSMFPSPGVLDPGMPEVARARAALLREAGVAAADILADHQCEWTGALPPPEPDGTPRDPRTVSNHEACTALGSYVTFVFGIPRPGGPYYPREGVDERERGGSRGHWTVRAIMTAPGASGGYDVVLRRVPGGTAWEVVEMRTMYVLAS